jgi:hypothetical protein
MSKTVFVALVPNVPQELALSDVSGIPEAYEVSYQTTDGRTLKVPHKVAVTINELDLKPGESFCICRDKTGMGSVTYRVWLPPKTEQGRAAAEAPALEQQLATSLEIVKGRKKPKRAAPEPQPRLFDRGTGTDGPAALPVTLPTRVHHPGRIPMNVAVSEIVEFVTKTLNATGEQWNDQAKQDLCSTVFIAAQKAGYLEVWERRNG